MTHELRRKTQMHDTRSSRRGCAAAAAAAASRRAGVAGVGEDFVIVVVVVARGRLRVAHGRRRRGARARRPRAGRRRSSRRGRSRRPPPLRAQTREQGRGVVRSGSTRAARHAVGRAGSKHTLQSRALLRLRIDRVSSLLFRLRERHRRRRAPVLGWARDREKASLALCAASRRFRRLSRRPNLGALASLLFLGAGELVLPMLRRGRLEPSDIRRDSPAVSSSIF